MKTRIDRVVLYWASCDGDEGWCCSVHSTDGTGRTVDSFCLPDEIQTESDAVAWLAEYYDESLIQISESDDVAC